MLGWNSLFKMLQEADPVWAQAQAQLQQAVKGKPGGQAGNSNASKNDSAHRAESNPGRARLGSSVA